MLQNGRVMKGFVFVAVEAIALKKEFDYWIDACLRFNEQAKPAKPKKK